MAIWRNGQEPTFRQLNKKQRFSIMGKGLGRLQEWSEQIWESIDTEFSITPLAKRACIDRTRESGSL